MLRQNINYDKLIVKLEEHLKLEEESLEEYRRTLLKIRSKVFREILEGILIDSIAHEELIKAIISVLKNVREIRFSVEIEKVPIEAEDLDKILSALKKHLEKEKETIYGFLELAEKTDIYSLRETLRNLFEDEMRHHAILENIIKTFEEAKGEK